MVESINYYQYHVCGNIIKAELNGTDWFRGNPGIAILALWHGNLDALSVWYDKVLAAYEEIDLLTSAKYKEEVHEVHVLLQTNLPLLLYLGEHEKAARIWSAVGFTGDEAGFDRFDQWFSDLNAFIPVLKRDLYMAWNRLAIFLSSPKGSIDAAEFNAWMPSPQELAEMERSNNWFFISFFHDLTSFGAKAFLKLGRDDDAYEVSRIAVSPEHATERRTTLVSCHSILGQIAAKRGDLDEAESHFANAVNEANLSRVPMVEVVAARDWKRHLLEPNGRGCEAAEAMIDAACARMKKTREQVASVLGADS